MATNNIARCPRVGSALPENVVWLPTAARRQVQNRRFAEQRRASSAKRKAEPWPGEFIHGTKREADQVADQLRQRLAELGVERTPEMCIMLALLYAMPEDVKAKAVRHTHAVADRHKNDDAAQGAALLLSIMTVASS